MKEETRVKDYDYPLKINESKGLKELKESSNNNKEIKPPSSDLPLKEITNNKVENGKSKEINSQDVNLNNLNSTPKIYISDAKRNITEGRKVSNRYIGGDFNENSYRAFSNYSIISNDNEKSVNMYVENDTYRNIADNLTNLSNFNAHISEKFDNPAKKVINFSKFSKEVLEELNFARTNPLSYAQKLERLLRENVEETNDGSCVLYIEDYPIRLKEGKKPFYEAINFLKKQTKIINLKTCEGVRKSAEDLVNIIVLHDGSTNNKDFLFNQKLSDINNRMNKYGAAVGDLNEIIDNGSFTPECVVLSFILCDGNERRRERGIIFSNLSKFVGVSSGITPSDNICTVINFAEHFYQRGDIIPSYIVERYKINPRFVGRIITGENKSVSISDKSHDKSHDKLNISTCKIKTENADKKDDKEEKEIKINLNTHDDNNYINTIPIGTYYNETDYNLNTLGNEMVYSKPKPMKPLNVQRSSEINFNTDNPTHISNDNIPGYAYNNSNNVNELSQSQIDCTNKPSKLIEPIKTIKGGEKNNINNISSSHRSSKYQVLRSFNLNGKASKERNESHSRSKSPEEMYSTNSNRRKSNFVYKQPPVYSNNKNMFNPIVELDLENEEPYTKLDTKPNRPSSLNPIPLSNINNIYNTNYYIISSTKNNSSNAGAFSSNRLSVSPHNRTGKSLEQEFIEYEVDIDVKNIQKLPEKVESIKMVEKPLNDHPDSRIVKKVISFKDGTSEVLLYQK